MKILMIGNEASGKTTYMGCSYGELHGGVDRFKFYSRNEESHNALLKIYEGVKVGKYPLMTDKRSSWYFDIYFERKKILELEWIDWNGGVITERSVQKLNNDIVGADAIIIFLEFTLFFEYDDDENLQLERILGLLGEKLISLNEDNRTVEIFFLLTQYDKVVLIDDKNINEDQCNYLMEFIKSTKENEFINCHLLPVSCTERGNINVDFPLLCTIRSALRVQYKECCTEIDGLEVKKASSLNKAGAWDNIVSCLKNEPTYYELANRATLRQRALIEASEKFIEAYSALTDTISNYVISWVGVHDEIKSSSAKFRKLLFRLRKVTQ